MKIWLTLPFNDNGIEEVELIEGPDDGCLRYWRGPGRNLDEGRKEGVDWHRTYEGAIAGALTWRTKRIEAALKEISHVNALPPLSPADRGGVE